MLGAFLHNVPLYITIGTITAAAWIACPLSRPIKPRKESLWPSF